MKFKKKSLFYYLQFVLEKVLFHRFSAEREVLGFYSARMPKNDDIPYLLNNKYKQTKSIENWSSLPF